MDPIENGDIPASYVIVYQRVYIMTQVFGPSAFPNLKISVNQRTWGHNQQNSKTHTSKTQGEDRWSACFVLFFFSVWGVSVLHQNWTLSQSVFLGVRAERVFFVFFGSRWQARRCCSRRASKSDRPGWNLWELLVDHAVYYGIPSYEQWKKGSWLFSLGFFLRLYYSITLRGDYHKPL